jgi:hypothetical protein
MGGILAALILVLVAWLWNDTLKAREQLLSRCRRACRDMNVQFLDETVACRRVRLKRSARGQLALARTYTFEFSADGKDRWPGRAVLLGRKIETLQMEGPEGVTILNGGAASTPRRLKPPSERWH